MSRYLLVNPWIYDFAAYDSGMRPAGLLRVGAQLRRSGHEVHLLDCLAGCATKRDAYGFAKIRKEEVEKPVVIRDVGRRFYRYGISTAEFRARLEQLGHLDGIYITSGMTYWYPGVQRAIQLLRERVTATPVTLGGIYATLCREHAIAASGADAVWSGGFPAGTPETGDGIPPAYDLLLDKSILPIQLTRGCPFRCSYCASRLLAPAFSMRDPVGLFEEIMSCHARFGTRTFIFYDDALAYRSEEGIKPFLRMVIDSKADLTFHMPNGIHARFMDGELAGLFKKAHCEQVRLSLETAAPAIQRATGDKVSSGELAAALAHLKKAGFGKPDIGVYLMIGAPWLDFDITMRDVQYIHSLGARAVLASYSPIPGTGDYACLIQQGIIPRDCDPLWHNKTVFPDLLGPSHMERVREIRQWTAGLNRMP